MSALPQRLLDDLYARYDLHPQLFDIYVEGQFDFDFINNIITEAGLNNISVFLIDDINIPPEQTIALGLNPGSKKNGVLTLGSLLDEKYQIRPTNITCLVDVDEDEILGSRYKLHHLSYTDYACMEAYFANSIVLGRFMQFGCNLSEQNLNEFTAVASAILPVQFTLRAVNKRLKLECCILSFETGINKKKILSSFDRKKYVTEYINHHRLNGRRTEIIEEFENIYSSLSGDLRHSMQGHDFIKLLFEYLWSKGGPKFQGKDESAEQFGGRLVGLCCRANELLAEPLFGRISLAASGKATMHP
jgi:hypothetical protein